MKHVYLLLLTSAAGTTATAQNPPEPEYVGTGFYIDHASGALVPLEKQLPNRAVKTVAMGFGGAKGSYFFTGERSPIRFKQGEQIEFVVRTNSPDVEPDSQVNLDSFKSAKGKREIVTVKAAPIGISAKTLRGQDRRALNFTKYGNNSLKFSPAQLLEPGEYVITTAAGKYGFLFGIDPKE